MSPIEFTETVSDITNDCIHIEKTWGYENIFTNNELYCGKIITINKDSISSGGKFHYHKIKDETFFVVDGCLILELIINGEINSFILVPDKMTAIRIKPNTPHRFKGVSDCTFIEVSTHHEDSDSYYLNDNQTIERSNQ
mgnify:CR=1 FL=1